MGAGNEEGAARGEEGVAEKEVVGAEDGSGNAVGEGERGDCVGRVEVVDCILFLGLGGFRSLVPEGGLLGVARTVWWWELLGFLVFFGVEV